MKKTKEIEFATFVYVGCIMVCNGSAQYVNGYLPEIARINSDRSIQWMRKRITKQMKDFVEKLAHEPFIATTAGLNQNFFDK